MKESVSFASKQRNALVDMLRGWALFSVVVMNYITIYHWNHHDDKQQTEVFAENLEYFLDLVLGSKGWTLLAILFGYGFSALLEKREGLKQSTHTFFVRRMLWLFVFALFNSIFFGGDILNDYAFLGLVMLVFHRMEARTTLKLGLLILLATPFLQSYLGNRHLLYAPDDRDMFYQLYGKHSLLSDIKANLFMRYKWMLRLSYSIIFHLIQIGCFLVGVYLHRSDFFSNMNVKLIRRIFFISLMLSILLLFIQSMDETHQWNINRIYHFYYPPILSVMMFITSGLIWFYTTGKCMSLFNALSRTGRMTLTNYVMQNIIAFVMFIFIRFDWSIYQYLLTAIVVFAIQVFFSVWWLRKFNYGPIEWLWRFLSAGKGLGR